MGIKSLFTRGRNTRSEQAGSNEENAADGSSTVSQEPGKVAEEFLRAFADGDVDAALGRLAQDARVEIPPAGVLGTAEKQGREFIAATVAAFPDLRLTVRKSFTGADGTVIAELTLEGTQTASYLGVINQEKHLDLDQVWVFTIADGRITTIKAFWCQNQLYRRLAVKRLDQLSIV
ncbi:nuclear transport factor 2 family protein [Amycolatopsis rubida]|uniref:SnoaL-like domain-containing protein n=1 Tax=Amycolatopsis rubida TaxID=112413 RepID=A0A1I5ND21_9PSEU|nr:nuclear transport factor 2 family protein [Amycolatopsis rubida]SFP19725.1 conserved hypothetical protein, steroid delta-isomerase-related [Amycolatopsis rubida]